MISVTVEQIRLAYGALRRINEETKLPQKAAWRLARLLGKMKPIMVDFEQAQVKIFLDAGGYHSGNGVSIDAPVRGEDETAEAWATRQKTHRELVNKLNDDVKKLNDEVEEIDYEPIPMSLFEDDEKTPVDKRRVFRANDFADAMPFLAEAKDVKAEPSA